jgi:hypothetical protein
MKKIVGMFILALLIGTTLTCVGMDNKNVNPENYIDVLKYEQNVLNDFDTCCMNRDGIFNPPVMTIDMENLIEDPISYEPSSVDLPEYFNWMDYEGQDWTTPVKDQGACGSCFIFGSLAALESAINIKEGIADLDPDLSEQYVLSCLPRCGGCWGGVAYTVFQYIKRDDDKGNNCNGIIPESCFPYQADDTIPCEEKCENWEDFLVPILNYSKFIGKDDRIEIIKSHIIQYGPIVSSMSADNENFTVWGFTNHNPDDYFPYEELTYIDHVIIIVGWKDDPSIEKGGYWICKNSWGPVFGYNGFFNIEYDSLGIGIEYQTWVDYNPDDYDWHPVPKAYGPYYGLVNEPVEFQGDAAGENPPFIYHWDFGDDSTSTEQNPSHTYTNPGEYIVRLTVTDDNGASISDETSAWIQENNQPPSTPIIEGPTSIAKDEYCWYNITFSDPDGSPMYLYAVAFGFESNIWWGPYPSEWGKEFIHLCWKEEGDFIVKAKVKDPYGAESDWAILEVTVTKNKLDFNTPIQQFLENYPLIYQLFQRLLKL